MLSDVIADCELNKMIRIYAGRLLARMMNDFGIIAVPQEERIPMSKHGTAINDELSVTILIRLAVESSIQQTAASTFDDSIKKSFWE